MKESTFSRADAGKKADRYVISVIDYLLGEGEWASEKPTTIDCIKKGNSNKSEENIKYTIDIADLLDEDKIESLRQLRKEAENPSPDLAADFDEIFKDRKDFCWTKIYKGVFSGFDDKKLKTDEQESIQGVFIAAAIEGSFSQNTKGIHSGNNYEVGYLIDKNGKPVDIWDGGPNSIYAGDYGDAVCNFTQKGALNLRSYKKQVYGMGKILHRALPKELLDFRGSSFSVIQPGGIINPKLKMILGSDYSIFVNALFVTSPKGKGMQKYQIDFGDSSLDKDTFAPADLYIVKNDEESLSTMWGELKNVLYKVDPLTNKRESSSVDDFVKLTNSFFNRGLAVPISLKLSQNPTWHKIINSNPDCLIDYSIDDIVSIKFNPTGNSIIEVKKKLAGKNTERNATFEFRRKGETSPWCCYANIKGNNDAFIGGNCKTYMRLAFQNPGMDEPITEEQLDELLKWDVVKNTMTKDSDPKVCLGIAQSGNAKMGGIGIGNFLWELYKAKERDSCITYVIQHSFKEAADIQDTLKLM